MDSGEPAGFWNCRIDASGRLTLPQELRNERGLHSGDELIVAVENGAIVLRSYDAAMQQLQDAFSEDIPRDVSLVDELIAERRQEAEREERR